MQTSVQLLIFILSISISPEQVPYHVQDVPAIVHIIFFVVASAQLMIPLVSYDIFKQEALEQKRMIEAREHAQVVFAGNIGEEFDSRLDDIALHCRNIKNNDDNAKVKQNADNIIVQAAKKSGLVSTVVENSRELVDTTKFIDGKAIQNLAGNLEKLVVSANKKGLSCAT